MHSNSGVDQYSPRGSPRADPESHSVPEAPSSATATATSTPTSHQSHATVDNSEEMPQTLIATMGPSVPNPNEMSPPISDEHMISALERHLSGGRSVSKKKKNRPKGKLDLIEDDDEPPLVFAADRSVSSARKKEVMSYAASRPHYGAQRASLDPPGTTMEDQEQLRLHSPQISTLHNNNDTNPEEEEPSVTMLPLGESVQLRVRSPQTSMLSNNNDPPGTSSSIPVFHVPEARLVVEDEESATPIQIHEATIVRTNSEQQADLPWWRRNQRNLVIGMLGVLCVIVAVIATLLASKGKNDSEGGSTNNSNLGGEESTANQTGVFDSNGPSETVTDPSTNEPPASIPNGLPSVKPTNTLVVMPIPSTNPNNITLTSQAKLVPDDGEASYFGFAVAVSGDTVVIGASKNDENGSNSGSAYVFHHDGENFIQQAKLLPNDGEAYDEFGFAVAVSGDVAVIGAHMVDDMGCDSGSAYVFIRDGDTWIQQAKLKPDDGKAGNHFGHAVGVSGSTIVVGAPYDDDNGSDSGSAYVFTGEGDTWNQQAKLKPKDGQDNDYFGKSLAVSGDTVVIGAERDDNDNGIDSGSAYVFIREGGSWHQRSKLLPNGGKEYDNFGYAVGVNGDTIVVGAFGNDDMGSLSDSAYVFIDNGDTWSQQAELSPSDGQAGGNFGHAVAVSGDTVIIGAKDDHGNHSDSGAAYVYIRDGEMWKQHAKLLPNRDSEDYDFGLAVAVDGDNVVIGTHRDSDNGNVSGSAYVFPLEWNA